jgi:hypothetical protein
MFGFGKKSNDKDYKHVKPSDKEAADKIAKKVGTDPKKLLDQHEEGTEKQKKKQSNK